jgi:hypothetical protein
MMHPMKHTRIALLAGVAALFGCDADANSTAADAAPTASDAAGPAPDATPPEPDAAPLEPDAAASIRGNRYCEILLAFLEAGAIRAEVWGTQGLNDCPAADWEAVDKAAVQAEFAATAVVLNGPRYWLIDAAEATVPDREPHLFGALEMRQLATINLPAGAPQAMPYVERTINRDSSFRFAAGTQVYELHAPDTSTYVMQSYAAIVDATLTEADLQTLGDRLALPDGWTYAARTLEAPLEIVTPGRATVLQDELQNTYSRTVAR